MKKEICELYDAIISINEEWEKKYGTTNAYKFPSLNITFGLYWWALSINDDYLFSDENNKRLYIDELDDYESWDLYLRREINNYVKNLSKYTCKQKAKNIK